MLRNSLIFVLLAGFAAIAYSLFSAFESRESLSGIAEYYTVKGPSELGSANLVSSVVVTYRGLDTLGEVTILFLTASIIGFFLKTVSSSTNEEKEGKTSEILSSAARLLVPIILLLGVYIFINGHLSPGGGFQGGAIIASAFVLMLMAKPKQKFNHKLISFIESISGISFVIIGLLGIFLAGGFLDNRIIELGEFGSLISAGAIPLIYIFIGLKVGSELTGIVSHFQETQNEV